MTTEQLLRALAIAGDARPMTDSDYDSFAGASDDALIAWFEHDAVLGGEGCVLVDRTPTGLVTQISLVVDGDETQLVWHG